MQATPREYIGIVFVFLSNPSAGGAKCTLSSARVREGCALRGAVLSERGVRFDAQGPLAVRVGAGEGGRGFVVREVSKTGLITCGAR